MNVRKIGTDDIEGMPYDVAIAAIEAGTHVAANLDAAGKLKPESDEIARNGDLNFQPDAAEPPKSIAPVEEPKTLDANVGAVVLPVPAISLAGSGSSTRPKK